MAKIETTLPTIAFGNVKVTFTPEELGVDISDAAAIGVAAAVYLNLFTQGFKTGSQMDVAAPSVTASEKAPSGAVSAPVGAPQEAPEEKAQAMLDEGLGGVTELPVGDDFSKSEEQITAEDGKAPWEAKVDAKPKPWETDEKPAPVALTPGW